jgi:triosephosphate isomerase
MKYVIANWKMKITTQPAAQKLVADIVSGYTKTKDTTMVLCPPFLYVQETKNLLGNTGMIGGQDCYWEPAGSYTGEVSAAMLADIGASFCIVGHSARRAMGETNEQVNKKITACIEQGITPVVCIGESDRDDRGDYVSFLETQIHETFAGFTKQDFEKIIVAYEPIWAINTGAKVRDCTPAECQETVTLVKKTIDDMTGNIPLGKITILYGGSVDRDTVSDFMDTGNIDGVLVGTASIDAQHFLDIVARVQE